MGPPPPAPPGGSASSWHAVVDLRYTPGDSPYQLSVKQASGNYPPERAEGGGPETPPRIPHNGPASGQNPEVTRPGQRRVRHHHVLLGGWVCKVPRNQAGRNVRESPSRRHRPLRPRPRAPRYARRSRSYGRDSSSCRRSPRLPSRSFVLPHHVLRDFAADSAVPEVGLEPTLPSRRTEF